MAAAFGGASGDSYQLSARRARPLVRPRRPILGLTHKRWSVQQMAIEWGVTPMWIPEAQNVEDLWSRSIDAAKSTGLVEAGDTVVITAGTAVNIPGSTNVIKVDVA